MAISEEGSGNGFYMPVAPAGGYGNSGWGGGDWAWIIILLLAFGGGFGNRGWGGGGSYGADGLYPWLNNSNQINDGFRDQMLNTTINGIQAGVTAGFGDVQNSLCAGFAGVNATINATQMADMERSFAVQSALQNCCCENRAGIADLKYTVATENCADRTQSLMNTRDIIESNTRNTQAILDKLCALELDGVKGQLAQAQRENVGLQNQLNMANLAASQNAQNALITKGFADEVDALYTRLSNCPVPTTPVYGRTPIFTCGAGSTGCGCGVA